MISISVLQLFAANSMFALGPRPCLLSMMVLKQIDKYLACALFSHDIVNVVV